MENMGYREGSSKLSKHRRMSRAASLAVEAGEGIPLSRYKTINVKTTNNGKKSMHQQILVCFFCSICYVRVWFMCVSILHISIGVSFQSCATNETVPMELSSFV